MSDMSYRKTVTGKRESAYIIERVGKAIEEALNKLGLSYENIDIEEEQKWNKDFGWDKCRSITVKITAKEGDDPAWKPTIQE